VLLITVALDRRAVETPWPKQLYPTGQHPTTLLVSNVQYMPVPQRAPAVLQQLYLLESKQTELLPVPQMEFPTGQLIWAAVAEEVDVELVWAKTAPVRARKTGTKNFIVAVWICLLERTLDWIINDWRVNELFSWGLRD
jgi:hypothetical protein